MKQLLLDLIDGVVHSVLRNSIIFPTFQEIEDFFAQVSIQEHYRIILEKNPAIAADEALVSVVVSRRLVDWVNSRAPASRTWNWASRRW